jgi:hypothetical protein
MQSEIGLMKMSFQDNLTAEPDGGYQSTSRRQKQQLTEFSGLWLEFHSLHS